MTAMQENVPRDDFDAVLFDMDGVVTDTASAHATAWKRLFDTYLENVEGSGFRPFDANFEYREYVDGKPRYDGVRSFLESRGIELPWGDPADGGNEETICGLGNRKDGYFNDWLQRNPVRVFPGTIEFIASLRAAGIRVAIFSASRNMETVLDSAGIGGLFDARVDGRLIERLGLPGKPDPAMLLEAASRVGVPAEASVIVEDAIAGVEAGARGAFARVVGIDRGDNAAPLLEHGADLVVNDLSEFAVEGDGSFALKHITALPGLRDDSTTLTALRDPARVAVLLDYDGTLTPIVADYRKAKLGASMRSTLQALAERHTVAVISGRDLGDVRRLVGLDSLFYSGSHGFELSGPDDYSHVHEQAAAYLPDLDRAEKALLAALAPIPGHAVERKHFSIAVHYRQVDEALVDDVGRVVDEVLEDNPRLTKGLGKKVFELKPALQWDKGRAIELLLDTLGMRDGDSVAVYIGDDVTDEAAFRVLRRPDYSIVIDDADRVTAADYVLADTDAVQRFLNWLSHPTEPLPV